MTVTIYHNPRCTKSRQTLELITKRGLRPAVIEYLKHPPDERTLADILQKLGMQALDLMRSKEPDFVAARDSLAKMTEHERIRWLSAHPVVIERPIVVCAGRARIGRPPEAVLDLLP
jgi:arsenate reductase